MPNNDNDNVIYIGGSKPEAVTPEAAPPEAGPPEVNQHLVELLEEMLVQAKSGDMQTLAYVAAYEDRVSTSWTVAPGDTDRTSSGVLHLAWRWGAELHGDKM